MYTRQEFEDLRKEWAQQLAGHQQVQDLALSLFIEADRFNWIHQTNWFGEPVLQLPQDMFAMQEIIFRSRPEYIVEVGVAWGGSLLFYSTLMSVLGGKGIIGIDIYIPDDLRQRIGSFGALSERIELVNASSIDPSTVDSIKRKVGGSSRVLVVLDSNHAEEHVAKELDLFSPLVKTGQYLVCSDTIVEKVPLQVHRPRAWGPGNNPMTALRKFLASCDRFVVDRELDDKLLLTCNPSGYLRCVKE
jgi:cephalosporin hydroxylase